MPAFYVRSVVFHEMLHQVVPPSERGMAFNNKPLAQRAAIVAAGPGEDGCAGRFRGSTGMILGTGDGDRLSTAGGVGREPARRPR